MRRQDVDDLLTPRTALKSLSRYPDDENVLYILSFGFFFFGFFLCSWFRLPRSVPSFLADCCSLFSSHRAWMKSTVMSKRISNSQAPIT